MEKLNVGILLFDDVEVLDFAGPFEVFSRTRLLPGVESRRSDESAPFHVFTVARTKAPIRTTGDLVARMQMTRKMRLPEAKQYVADKLHVTSYDLSDPTMMRQLREELDIGTITGVPGIAKGLAAKARISQLLDIPINSVEQFKRKTGLHY